jgi:hypothetical protein
MNTANLTALTTALKSTAKAAQAYTDMGNKALRTKNYDLLHCDERKVFDAARTVIIGRVAVTARVGGNSVAQHVRHTFKIDGKRATRVQAEAVLLA